MDDYIDNLRDVDPGGFFSRLSPASKAALIFAVPFTAADFFNYYSAGTSLIISLPVQIILYIACGALAAYFASNLGEYSTNLFAVGAKAGFTLWLISTVVNTILALIFGALTFGGALLLGLPYLCLCAPVQAIGGILMGGMGGFILGLFHSNSSPSDPI